MGFVERNVFLELFSRNSIKLEGKLSTREWSGLSRGIIFWGWISEEIVVFDIAI